MAKKIVAVRGKKPKAKPLTTAQKLKDPSLRSKLPDSALSPSQLAMRKRNQRIARENKNPLYNPGAPLGGSQLASSARQLTDLKYGPLEQQIGRNVANTTTQGTALQGRAKDYYAQLAQQEQRGVQTQAALGAMLNQRQDAIGAQAQNALAAAASAERQRLGSDADLRGQGLQGQGATGDIAALTGLAAANQANAQTSANLGTGAWAGYSNALAQARGLKGAEVQGQIGNRILNAQTKAREDLTELARERGNATAQNVLNLRQTGFENLAATKTLNLKAEDLALEGEQIKTQAQLAKERLKTQREIAEERARLTARGQDISASTQIRGQDISSRDRRAALEERRRANRWKESNRGGGGTAGLTPAQKVKRSDDMISDVNSAISIYKSALRQHKTGPRAIRAMRSRGVPENVIHMAVDLSTPSRGRRLTPARYRQALRLGMVVPPEWRPRGVR